MTFDLNYGHQKKVVLAAPIPLQSVGGSINWDICCICQKAGGDVTCSAENPNAALRNAGYYKFANNVENLKGTSHVFPSGRKAEHFDEGSGVTETLIKNTAKWHKKCILKYTSRFNPAPETPALDSTDRELGTFDVKTRSSSVAVNPKEEVCFLCKRPPNKNQPLHRCMTFEIYHSIKQYATKAGDNKVLALLAEGDLVAQEAKYHSICVLNLHSKGKHLSSQQSIDSDACESLAFADLLLYMHEKLEESGTRCAFKSSDLLKLYNQRYCQLLAEDRPLSDVHNSRFRERILLHFPDLQALKSGREYVLTPKSANILKNLEASNDDIDALAVNRFIRKIRDTVFSTTTKFTGSFKENCEESCIPSTLLALVNMILYGSTISSECRGTKPALSISQLLLANIMKGRPSGNIVRFNKAREPPLPLYLGLSMYGSAHDKTQIDNLHHRGICVSSNRIYEVTADLARFVVKRAGEEGVVCPSALKKGLFTVGAFDNIDIKTSSTTSVGEFHGSGISLFQLPLNGEISRTRTWNTSFEEAAVSGSRHVPKLPDEYSNVQEDFNFKSSQPSPPPYSLDVRNIVLQLSQEPEELWHGEIDWLDHVHNHLTEKDFFRGDLSWAAFRAGRQGDCPLAVSNNSLLPLFENKSATPGMVKHAMDIVKQNTDFLNFGQTPVLCVDQPLFTLAKMLQWNYPHTYGEEKFVVLFGPLHIEQNFLRVLGDIMEGCGWTTIIANSGILSAGSAEGLLKVSSITKSRLFHQYTAAVLYSLLKDAHFNDHPDSEVTFDSWIEENVERSPTFKFWLLVLQLQLLLLKFVKSVRESHFEAFKKSIIAFLPWFFTTGHHLYARWLSVHALDLVSLEKKAPEVYRRFSMGAFVVRKTLNPFSSLGIDHAHEQNNAAIKSAGGALGLTQDPSALRRWTIAGPEVTRLLSEFEESHDQQKNATHHEQYPKFQTQFYERCSALKESFLECENPFLIKNEELIALDTRVEVGERGIEALNTLEIRGVTMLRDFSIKRFDANETSFYDPVKKENAQIFASKKKVKPSSLVADLKLDLQLFSRLFIVSMARSLDLQQFFDHENQECPPALSTKGNIRTGQKSKLVPILEKFVEDRPPPKVCDGIVLDGAAVVRWVKPREESTSFQKFSEGVTHYCINMAEKMHCSRVDIVWDQYLENSLKTTTRLSRGAGTRRPGLPQKGTFPKQQKMWEDYLKNDGNKSELFQYLAKKTLEAENLHIVTNVGDIIQSNSPSEDSALNGKSCAAMEEADGRLFLHAQDMAQHGAKCILIRCSDTDIVVLAVSFFYHLCRLGLRELWVLYGTGTSKRFVATHLIAQKLGEDRACALRGFHAFTGCDSVSFFNGKGKISAWDAWDERNEEMTQAFKILGMPAKDPPDIVLPVLERFVVRLYKAEATCDNVRDTRKYLFASEGKSLLFIPCTLGCLKQHARRAAYQAGKIWGSSLQKSWDNHQSPAGWGWTLKNGHWVPHWTDDPNIWVTCRELSVCGCGSGCSTKRCSCKKAGLPCTLACRKCTGSCENTKNVVSPAENDEVDVDLRPQ